MNITSIRQSPSRTVPLAVISVGVVASHAGASLLVWLLLRLL
jgi:hypothetical protein